MPTCQRCLNTSLRYFVLYRGKWVCRRCIGFTGENATIEVSTGEVSPELPFQLTMQQKEASKMIEFASRDHDVLVNAVCGAGKTELVLKTISSFLSKSMTVGLAIARRQVVLQLAKRLQAAFPSITVQAVCEGHTSILNAQLFIVTTHQLYRFPNSFDCLILDEPDAFPYYGDKLLEGFARKACRGNMIYLTATPDKEMLKRVRSNKLVEVQVNIRPHGHPLPIPMIRRFPFVLQIVFAAFWLNRTEGRRLVFVPTISNARFVGKLLKLPIVYAGYSNLDSVVSEFSRKEDGVLVCTTVLERGLTFENVHVCVLKANHQVFNTASLIQIAGRAGRTSKYPEGKVLFLCETYNRSLRACMIKLHQANKDVCSVSLP